MFGFVPASSAQTGSTGALTGTVTDPSGGVVVGATVTITNVATGQARTVTTDNSGSYKAGLLTPGNYSVKFAANGFKTITVPSVTVNVTETPVLDQKLEIGGQAVQVTVESTVEQAIQTQNATNGGLVSGQEVNELPLVSRNYTQIIALSPGTVGNATTSSAIGNGTQDISANGSRGDQNNYSMDGSSVVNYVSGTASQSGSFPGIAIPNPDSIQEFKVQTSQYDASSGRNPGANVEVVTKGGSNNFHGDLWEYNRNNFFNANDYFFKRTETQVLDEPNTPQTLKQNTFGGTLGGHIIKDKLFFFGSYQGLRQVNGVGTSGFAFGFTPNTNLLPWNDVADFSSGVCSDLRCSNNDAAYRAYLGHVFAGDIGDDGQPVAANGSNISNTALAYLQAKGLDKGPYNQGFYIPSAPQTCGGAVVTHTGCTLAISEPIRANEDQYLGNADYVISNKNTLYERFLFGKDPQTQTFNCFINGSICNPGAPINALYENYVGQLKLSTVVTSNFVNEARFSFHRDIENNTDPTPVLSCDLSSAANVIPLVNDGAPCPLVTTGELGAIAKKFPEANIAPILDILGGPSGPWSQGGNFAMISTNYINTFQFADQISWNHGKQTIRAGFEAERIQYNNTIPASIRGELLIGTTSDFLTSSAGPPGTNPADPTYDDGTPFVGGGVLTGFGLKGPLTHYNRINAFSSYVQDDIKVNRKLTVNLGLRWEYDGFPDDKSGQFTNVWNTQLAKFNTGSAFLNDPTGTLIGFIVPSNFDKTAGFAAPNGATGVLVNNNKTLLPGSPWHNFAPRVGLAWQPLSEKFVVRAGFGLFYDRVYGNLLIDNQLNLPPYAGTAAGTFPATQSDSLHNPWFAASQTPLGWTPRFLSCAGPCNPALDNISSSDLGYTSDAPLLGSRLPLVQEYNVDLQYALPKGWVVDIGYVGSHGIHLYNYAQDQNVAGLVAGAPNNPTAASGPWNTEMIRSSLPFNDPNNPTQLTTNTLQCFGCGLFNGNANLRVPYLGFADNGLATTTTNGDELYNSLQAQVKHQFGHGLTFQLAYTWSKEFTNVNSSESGGFLQPNGGVLNAGSNLNDPVDLRQQYGLAAFERPQRVVISFVYNFPSKFHDGVLGKVTQGWQISGVTTIQDGQPFSIVDGGGGTIYGAGTARALLIDPTKCTVKGCQPGTNLATSGSTTQRLGEWFDTSAFQPLCTPGAFSSVPTSACPNPLPASSPYCIGGFANPTGSADAPCGIGFGNPEFPNGANFPGAGSGYGNSAMGIVFGPGQYNQDAAIVKDTKIWEHGTVQFRAEFFNVWNHAQFNPPGNNVNTPETFGIVNSTANTPRVVQFALKYMF
jgi:Carboxypeptidase regulatory-like domain